MRRLPVYLVLDTSGSMMGEPIESVKKGLDTMVSSLRQNPQAIETAYLSVITFDSAVRQVVPLTDLASFQAPNLRAGGATELGAALKLVAQKIDSEVATTTTEQKGDWKPLVFIMTDGVPTDKWQEGWEVFKRKKVAFTVACAAGRGADTSVLRKITDNVILLHKADADSVSKFFAWVTASIGVSSTTVENSGNDTISMDELPPPPPELNIIL